MVVVFLSHNYPREPGDLPGAFLHTLAVALRDRGHDVRVVAPSDRGRGGRELLDGIPVRRVRYAAPARETLGYGGISAGALRSLGGLLTLRRLIRALRQGARAEAAHHQPPTPPHQPVIHAHWWFPAGFAAPPDLPFVVTLHGTDGRLFAMHRIARWLGRRVLRRARLVTVVSPGLAQVAETVSGRSEVASHVQPMPVDSSAFPWSRGGGGLLVVARLTEQKRVHLAIRGASCLGGQGTPLPLTIIGDGPERQGLERLAEIHSTIPIRFLGQRPSAEVRRALETADALLFTAREEGLGLAAIEALMAGVPVVACDDGGGVLSALGRFGGGVVTGAMRWEFSAGIRQALEPARREEARQAGLRWREELAPARVAERFEAWYEEALAH